MIKLLNTNSFLNKISVQEASLGRFICPKCSTFCTNSKTEYEDHLRENHIDYNQVSCIYCAVNFDFSKISNHIESHFEENLMSTNICNLCNISVKMDSQESVLDHLMYEHNNELICPLCKIEYNDPSELIDHINGNLKIVYHCTYEECQMKTNDNEELNFHKNISGHISDSCFEEHTFNCLFKDDESKFIFLEEGGPDLSLLDEPQLAMGNNDDNCVIVEEIPEEKPKLDFIWQLKCRKEGFAEVFKYLSAKEAALVKDQLFSIEQYSIGIVMKNDKNLYCCLECDYAPQYSHWDVKKHILTNHCMMSARESRRSLKIIEFSKQKVVRSRKSRKSNTSVQAPLAPPLTPPTPLTPLTPSHDEVALNVTEQATKQILKPTKKQEKPPKFNSIFKLKYRPDLLSELYKDVYSTSCVELQQKLSDVERYFIGISTVNNKKVYYCSECSLLSYYSNWDVKKHILAQHCSATNFELRKCIRLVELVDSYETETENKKHPVKTKAVSADLIPEVAEPRLIWKPFQNTRRVSAEGRTARRPEKFSYRLRLVCRMESFGQVFKNISLESRTILIEKMGPIDGFSMGVIVGKGKKSFYCLMCDYVSYYSNWDVKKHILIWHCGICNADSYKAVRLIDMVKEECEQEAVDNPTQSEVVSEVLLKQEQKKPELEMAFITGNGIVERLNYSIDKLRKVFARSRPEFVAEITEKMDEFRRYSIEVMMHNDSRSYLCGFCGYTSNYNKNDVKKHVMAKHCNISANHAKNCIKLCRRDLTIDGDAYISEEPISVVSEEPDKAPHRDPPVVLEKSPHRDLPVRSDISPDKSVEHDSPMKRKSGAIISDDGSAKKHRGSGAGGTPLVGGVVEDWRRIPIERDVELGYSESILRRLCDLENLSDKFEDLSEQLGSSYCLTRVRVARRFESDIFICSQCNWFTWKSIAVVASHVLRCHTGIDPSLKSLVEASTKMDTTGQLLTDIEMSKLGWNGKSILFQKSGNLFVDLSSY